MINVTIVKSKPAFRQNVNGFCHFDHKRSLFVFRLACSAIDNGGDQISVGLDLFRFFGECGALLPFACLLVPSVFLLLTFAPFRMLSKENFAGGNRVKNVTRFRLMSLQECFFAKCPEPLQIGVPGWRRAHLFFDCDVFQRKPGDLLETIVKRIGVQSLNKRRAVLTVVLLHSFVALFHELVLKISLTLLIAMNVIFRGVDKSLAKFNVFGQHEAGASGDLSQRHGGARYVDFFRFRRHCRRWNFDLIQLTTNDTNHGASCFPKRCQDWIACCQHLHRKQHFGLPTAFIGMQMSTAASHIWEWQPACWHVIGI